MSNNGLINVRGFKEHYRSTKFRRDEIYDAVSELLSAVLDREESPNNDSLKIIAERFSLIRQKELTLESEATDKRYAELTKFVAKELGFTSTQGRQTKHSQHEKESIAEAYHLMHKATGQARVILRDDISKKFDVSLPTMRKYYSIYRETIEAMEGVRANVDEYDNDLIFLTKLVSVLSDTSVIGNPLQLLEVKEEGFELAESLGGGVIQFRTNKNIDPQIFTETVVETYKSDPEKLMQRVLVESQIGGQDAEILENIELVEYNWDECIQLLKRIYPV